MTYPQLQIDAGRARERHFFCPDKIDHYDECIDCAPQANDRAFIEEGRRWSVAKQALPAVTAMPTIFDVWRECSDDPWYELLLSFAVALNAALRPGMEALPAVAKVGAELLPCSLWRVSEEHGSDSMYFRWHCYFL